MAKAIFILENFDHSCAAIMVPNGDLKRAQIITGPYAISAPCLSSSGAIELLRTYEKIPNYPVN